MIQRKPPMATWNPLNLAVHIVCHHCRLSGNNQINPTGCRLPWKIAEMAVQCSWTNVYNRLVVSASCMTMLMIVMSGRLFNCLCLEEWNKKNVKNPKISVAFKYCLTLSFASSDFAEQFRCCHYIIIIPPVQTFNYSGENSLRFSLLLLYRMTGLIFSVRPTMGLNGPYLCLLFGKSVCIRAKRMVDGFWKYPANRGAFPYADGGLTIDKRGDIPCFFIG